MGKDQRWRVGRFVVTERVGKLGKTYKVRGTYYGPHERTYKTREEAFKQAADMTTELESAENELRPVVTTLSHAQVKAAELIEHRAKGKGYGVEMILDRLDKLEPLLMPVDSVTVADRVDHWVEHRQWLLKRGDIAQATYDHDYQHSRWLKADPIGSLPIAVAAHGHFEAELKKLESNKTYNHRRSKAFAVMREAVKDGVIAKNPLEQVRALKKKRGKGCAEFLHFDKVQDVLRRVEAYQDGRYVHNITLGLFAGLRPQGEMNRLSVRDVNVDKGIIRISIDTDKNELQTPQPIMPILAEWIRVYPLSRYAWVPNLRGGKYTALRKELGLADRKYHDVLRHTALTMYYAMTESLNKTAKFGRDNEGTVLHNYVNTFVDKREGERYWTELLPLKGRGEKVVNFG